MNQDIQSICQNYELKVSLFDNDKITKKEKTALFDISNRKLIYGKSFFFDSQETIESVYLPHVTFRTIKHHEAELLEYKSNSFFSHYITLEDNKACLTDDITLLQEGKSSFKKYRTIARIFPYVRLEEHLSNALSIVHQYIATNKLDMNELQNIINTLKNTYYELAPNSLALLCNFKQNPKNCDMRNLCNSLALSIKNINKQIEFKSEDLFSQLKR